MPVEQCAPHAGRRQRDDQVMREHRTRARRGVPVCLFVIGVAFFLQGEAVDILPPIAHETLKQEAVVRQQPECLVRCCLFLPRTQRQGRGRGQAAETDIGQERALRQIDAQQHVAAGGLDPMRHPAPHARHQAHGGEPQRPQRRQKQSVLLVAITAAPAMDQLALQRFQIQRRRPPSHRIDVLERDRRAVPRHQLPQYG